MQLRDYFRIVATRGWIIVLSTVLTIASALVFSFVMTPVYRSTIYLNVWPSRLDWGLQQTIQSLMRNYAGKITSRDTALAVINKLELDITPDELREKLTVQPIQEDFLIRIDADDYDPLIARDIAQTTAETFVADIKVYMLEQDQSERLEVSIRDYALPGTLHKPKWKVNALAGAVFGLMVGVLIAFVLEWLESDIIRTSDDIGKHIEIAVLGSIPVTASGSTRTERKGAGS